MKKIEIKHGRRNSVDLTIEEMKEVVRCLGNMDRLTALEKRVSELHERSANCLHDLDKYAHDSVDDLEKRVARTEDPGAWDSFVREVGRIKERVAGLETRERTVIELAAKIGTLEQALKDYNIREEA